MSDLKQFLDWGGLKHYDEKIKDYIGDRTCSIGEDGYWYIGGEKTEYKAAGQDGAPGADGADGAPGQDGQDGTSVTITSTDKVDGVTTITFSDGNTITINDGIDGQDGEDGDELNLQLGEEITTNVECGALGIGQTLGADLTLADVVKKLTTKVYEPSTGNPPKATLTMSNQDTEVEVGTTITPTLTPKFTDGTFKTYGQGATSTTNMNAGCSATGYTISRVSTIGKTTKTDELFDSADIEGDFTGLAVYTDNTGYKIGEETVKYTTTISYSASTKYPQDSNGVEDTTVIWDGSSASANSTSIIGKYQYYTGIGDTNPTASEIRAVLDTTTNWVADEGEVSITNITNTKTIFAIPSSYELVKAMSVNTNDDLMSDFKEEQITIEDAGGSDTIYKMYVMTNAQPGNLLVNLTYKKI